MGIEIDLKAERETLVEKVISIKLNKVNKNTLIVLLRKAFVEEGRQVCYIKFDSQIHKEEIGRSKAFQEFKQATESLASNIKVTPSWSAIHLARTDFEIPPRPTNHCLF